MQDIIASLPEHVLNYKDTKGRTIIDWEFNPFAGADHTKNIANVKNGRSFKIIRPHYIMEEIECNGKKLKVIKEKVEGNIQEAIDNKVNRVYIYNQNAEPLEYINSFEDDVYKLLDAGHIQFLSAYPKLKSNGKQYHVDFVNIHQGVGDNITSYYNHGRETAKTVVLRSPTGPITNNLISLGNKYIYPEPYPEAITSKFIGYTNYTNIRSKHQDILDMLDAIKAKIEVL